MTEVVLPDRLDADGFSLRRLRAGDATAVAAAFRDDPDLGRLLGFETDPDVDWVSGRLERTHELVVADPDTDAFLGMVLLHSHDEHSRRAEVAFWLVAGARRRGIGGAAVRLLLDWAIRELDLLRVELTTTLENVPTQAFAESLGFTREGVMRKRNVERGVRVDVVAYGVLREEWPGA
jgi:[ribosomal protein S5]-alanine N-acetyltransferase